jgi:hypothetical protein
MLWKARKIIPIYSIFSIDLNHFLLAPYGVRESAQKLGRRGLPSQNGNFQERTKGVINPREKAVQVKVQAAAAGKEEETVDDAPGALSLPSKMRYPFGRVFLDLMDLSAGLLRRHGRLAFWLPVHRNE